MAVAGTLLLVGRAGLVVSLITIVTVPIWAILGNLLRIYSVVIGLEFFGLDLSAGLKHTLLGLVTFSLAAWAHWSSVQFLNLMAYKFSPNSNLKIDEQTDVATSISSVAHEKNLEMVSKSSLLFPALMFTLTPMVFISFQAQESRLPIINNAINAMLPTENDLPKLSHGSARKSFYIENRDGNSVLGLHSRVWWYSNGDVKQLASLDLPFRGWHGLWGCYEASGWTNLGTTVKDAAIDGNRLESPYFETQLRNSDGTYALLQFSLFDVNGQPFIYEFESLTASVRSRWTRSVFHRGFEIVQGDTIPITFQFQLLSRSSEPPTDEQQQTYREMFLEFRETIREKSMPAFRKLREANN